LQGIKLTPTSYIVLGLLARRERTPYELKTSVADGVGNMWSLQHTQVYAEPERLAASGYLTVTQEETGRRRKVYRITDAGREALGAWLAAPPTDELPEIRDIHLLKVFFGADPLPIARRQAHAHEAKLAEYQELTDSLEKALEFGQAMALRAGIAHEREMIQFWLDVTEAADLPGEAAWAAGRRGRLGGAGGSVAWAAGRRGRLSGCGWLAGGAAAWRLLGMALRVARTPFWQHNQQI
jgi:DNA-binding PadR family transcriptional regulator